MQKKQSLVIVSVLLLLVSTFLAGCIPEKKVDEQRVKALKAQTQVLKAEVNRLGAEVADLRITINEDLTQQDRELNTEVAQLGTEAAHLGAKVARLSGRTDSLEGGYDEMAAVKEELKDLDVRLAQFNREVARLDMKIAQLDARVRKSLKPELSGPQVKLTLRSAFDDHYGQSVSNYQVSIRLNGREIFYGNPKIEHGRPFNAGFTNFKNFDILFNRGLLQKGENRLQISLSGVNHLDWFCWDYFIVDGHKVDSQNRWLRYSPTGVNLVYGGGSTAIVFLVLPLPKG